MYSYCTCLAILLTSLTTLAQQAGEIYSPLERGKFLGSERVGVWTYYDTPSAPALTIDYSKGELLYFKPDTSAYIVKEGNQRVSKRLSRPCRFHGSYLTLFQHYEQSIGIPYSLLNKAEKSKEPIQAQLIFEVGDDGVARNPEVIGDPGFGVPRAMVKAFESAPNAWITGIQEDGKPCTCMMGIEFRICVDSCPPPKPSNAAKLIYGVSTVVGKRPGKPASFLTMTVENQGIQFSPDNKKILMETTSLGYSGMSGYGGLTRGLVVDRETGNITVIPFSNINGCFWLSDERIFFKYSIPLSPNHMAEYNLTTGDVTTLADSVTYFNVTSPDMTKMAFATRYVQGSRIWVGSREKKDFTLVHQDPSRKLIPIGWSPKQDKLLISGREDDFVKTIIVDIATTEKHTIPLFNMGISGWSPEENTIYLYKQDNISSSGSMHNYKVSTGEIKEVDAKVKGLTLSMYSTVNKYFALILKGDAYIQRAEEPFQPIKLMDNVFNLGWSRDGKYLALVGSKDKQLYICNIESREIRKLTDWIIK